MSRRRALSPKVTLPLEAAEDPFQTFGPLLNPDERTMWTMNGALGTVGPGGAARRDQTGHRTPSPVTTNSVLPLLLLCLCLVDICYARTLPSTSKFDEKYPCRNYREEFNDPRVLTTAENWTGGPAFVSEFAPHAAEIRDGQLFLRVNSTRVNGYGNTEGLQAAVSWTRWFDRGRACASMKTAKGGGMVSAVVAIAYNETEPNIDDEVDLEWVGKDGGRFLQTNFFSQSISDYGNGIIDHPIPSADSGDNFHTYCFERTGDAIVWSMDGTPVRTEYFSAYPGMGADGGFGLPWRESRIVFNIWDGGQGDPGTAYWAGGPTNWLDPAVREGYRLAIDWFEVTCYAPFKPDPVVAVQTADASGGLRPLKTTRTRSGGAMAGIAVAATNPVAKPVIQKYTGTRTGFLATVSGTFSGSKTLTGSLTMTSMSATSPPRRPLSSLKNLATIATEPEAEAPNSMTRTSRTTRLSSILSTEATTAIFSRATLTRSAIFASPPPMTATSPITATETAVSDSLSSSVSANSSGSSSLSGRDTGLVVFAAVAGTTLLTALGYLVYRFFRNDSGVEGTETELDEEGKEKPAGNGRASPGSDDTAWTAEGSPTQQPSSPGRPGLYPAVAAVPFLGCVPDGGPEAPNRRESLAPMSLSRSVRFANTPPQSPVSPVSPIGPGFSWPVSGMVSPVSSVSSTSQMEAAMAVMGVHARSPVLPTIPSAFPSVQVWNPGPRPPRRKATERVRITYGEGVQSIPGGAPVSSGMPSPSTVARAMSPIPPMNVGERQTIYYSDVGRI